MPNTHKIGTVVYPDNNELEELNEDFYSSSMDDDDNLNEVIDTDAILCCAGCFTTVCYKCKLVGGTFHSSVASNVYVDGCPTSQLSVDGDENFSVKRKEELNTNGNFKTVKCIECCNIVGDIDEHDRYTFKNIIANRP